MDEKQVRDLLRVETEKAGSSGKWAKEKSISAAYVADVLAARRSPGELVLNALGLERVTTYRKTIAAVLKAGRTT